MSEVLFLSFLGTKRPSGDHGGKTRDLSPSSSSDFSLGGGGGMMSLFLATAQRGQPGL